MANYADYFAANRYQPTYFLGDRVFGRYENVPFMGTVGNDTVYSEDDGPIIAVMLDLPLVLNGTTVGVIIVKHQDVTQLSDLDVTGKKPKKVTKKCELD